MAIQGIDKPPAQDEKENIVIIYAGNLSHQTTGTDLKKAFKTFGHVSQAAIIKDIDSGRSKRFGYVLMLDKTETQSAINGLNGKNLNGKTLKVNALSARPLKAKRKRHKSHKS